MIQRMVTAVKADLAGLASAFARNEAVPRGLLAYDFEKHGGRTRLHLRVQKDGSGLLFRDVTDVIHLSDTAALMCWMALENVPEKRAAQRLVRTYRNVGRDDLASDYRQIRRLVETLSDP